jgi:hypothetical protein
MKRFGAFVDWMYFGCLVATVAPPHCLLKLQVVACMWLIFVGLLFVYEHLNDERD